MKGNTRIYNKFQGYSPSDVACEYCLYFGGKRKGKITCMAEKCVCEEEIRHAKEAYRRERRKHGQKR